VIRAPFIVLTAGWVQYLPLLGLGLRRNWSRPVLWVAAGLLVSVIGNALGRIAAHRLGNNHWVGYIDSPLMFALFLAAISEWQVTARESRIIRVGIVAVLTLYTGLVAFVEDVTTFPVYAMVLCALALLAAGVWTLLRRAFSSFRVPILRSDWFWIVGGLTLYGATTGAVEPIARILLAGGRIDLFTAVYSLRAVCIDIAFLLVTAGFLIPPPPPHTVT
jgi:hypothetical protein